MHLDPHLLRGPGRVRVLSRVWLPALISSLAAGLFNDGCTAGPRSDNGRGSPERAALHTAQPLPTSSAAELTSAGFSLSLTTKQCWPYRISVRRKSHVREDVSFREGAAHPRAQDSTARSAPISASKDPTMRCGSAKRHLANRPLRSGDRKPSRELPLPTANATPISMIPVRTAIVVRREDRQPDRPHHAEGRHH